MSFDLSELSVVEWFKNSEKHRCGYCKNENCSISNGMWADSLTVEDYQDLIDRGWRRSGKYCYKPILSETCCPQYTIRCDAMNIKLTKSQKKVIKKFNKFLGEGVINKKDIPPEAQYAERPDGDHVFRTKNQPTISVDKIQGTLRDSSKSDQGNTQIVLGLGIGEPCHVKYDQKANALKNDSDRSEQPSEQKHARDKTLQKGVGADTSKPPCKKAKLLRIEKKKEKLNKLGLGCEKKQSGDAQKSIEQFLEEIPDNSKVKLRLQLIPTSEPSMDEWNRVSALEYQLYRKYQMIVHNDPPEKLSMAGFDRFLVKSPLKPKEFPDADGPGFGTFHQQYWLDDKLIAVGVIDILPRSVSSVYFFYDPDYRSLTLGTYGSLREVELARSLQKKVSDLQHYYMGFYIHSCPKMRYKGKLVPSYLACPETYVWVPIEKCVKLLDVSKYSRFNEDLDGVDEDFVNEKDLSSVKVVRNYKLMYFRTFKAIYPEATDLFSHIGMLIGKRCMNRIVFWIT